MAEVLRKPAALRPGDTVALVAPCGPCDPKRLALGVSLLQQWRLRVVNLDQGSSYRYFAGSDSQRASQLIDAFGDAEVKAVLAVRGGSGAARLSAAFNPAVHCRDAKIFVGFSDVTTLLARVVQEAGMICYHGPMVGADLPRLSDASRERFRRFLFGERDWFVAAAARSWRGGLTSGPLMGGCLSVLVTSLGTPYEIQTEGTVLFLEDVAEKSYRIDRMLTHLKHAGKFEGVRGLLLGPMTDCDDGQGEQRLRQIVLDVLGDSEFPIVYGFDAGHGSGNVVLPFGARVRLDGDGARLELEEPVFA